MGRKAGTGDDAICSRCPFCRSTNIVVPGENRKLTVDSRRPSCNNCKRRFDAPFIGTRYEKVKTKDAARVAAPMTVGRGTTRW